MSSVTASGNNATIGDVTARTEPNVGLISLYILWDCGTHVSECANQCYRFRWGPYRFPWLADVRNNSCPP